MLTSEKRRGGEVELFKALIEWMTIEMRRIFPSMASHAGMMPLEISHVGLRQGKPYHEGFAAN